MMIQHDAVRLPELIRMKKLLRSEEHSGSLSRGISLLLRRQQLVHRHHDVHVALAEEEAAAQQPLCIGQQKQHQRIANALSRCQCR